MRISPGSVSPGRARPPAVGAFFDDYRAAFLRLKERGVVYPCFCSRKEIAAAIACRETETDRPWPRDPGWRAALSGHLPKPVRRGGRSGASRAGEPHAWRLDSAQLQRMLPGPYRYRRFDREGREEIVAADPWRWGDAVIVRKETPTSYHLSVVVDDALQGSPMWSAARISRRRPISTCCCRPCSACRRRSIITMGLCSIRPATSWRRAASRPSLAEAARRGSRPAGDPAAPRILEHFSAKWLRFAVKNAANQTREVIPHQWKQL